MFVLFVHSRFIKRLVCVMALWLRNFSYWFGALIINCTITKVKLLQCTISMWKNLEDLVTKLSCSLHNHCGEIVVYCTRLCAHGTMQGKPERRSGDVSSWGAPLNLAKTLSRIHLVTGSCVHGRRVENQQMKKFSQWAFHMLKILLLLLSRNFAYLVFFPGFYGFGLTRVYRTFHSSHSELDRSSLRELKKPFCKILELQTAPAHCC